MDRMIYTAMSGAQQSMNRQAIISNNLANVSTGGFRAQLQAMRAVPVQGDGAHKTRVSVAETTPGSDFSPGPIHTTGRDLDVAMRGHAWLAVQNEQGQEAYTRRGDLQVNANGMLMSANHPVLGDDGDPIVVPLNAQLSMGTDGTISAIMPGSDARALVQAGRLKMVTRPDDQPFVRAEDGLFQPQDANGNATTLPEDQDARLASGALEGSNVSAIQSMVSMITAQRMYEMQIKGIQTEDNNAQQANQLLSIR